MNKRFIGSARTQVPWGGYGFKPPAIHLDLESLSGERLMKTISLGPVEGVDIGFYPDRGFNNIILLGCFAAYRSIIAL